MKELGYLTLRQVMKKYGKTYTQVRYATQTNRLKGVKIGWQWLYPQSLLPEEWPETPRKQKGERNKNGENK